MKLYGAVDRVHRDLRALGFSDESAVPVDVLARFDQLHYHGTDAVDHSIQATGISEKSCVLDIGAGYGGPARWVAHRTGARVDAVELQGDLNATAEGLTARAGLSDQVRHVQGDILKTPLESDRYDSAISFLALYHIPDRAPLFPKIQTALKPGGRIYVEDLYLLGTPSAAEQADLDGMMQANTLPDRAGYIAELERAGFKEISFEDMTGDWADFTAGRLAAFRGNRLKYQEVHGAEVFDALDHFYTVIADLLAGGNLGGVRLSARKP